MAKPKYRNPFFEEIRNTYMGSRKESVLLSLSKELRTYRNDISDTVRNNLLNEASLFPRLAFLNPSLLAAGLVMYHRDLREDDIRKNYTILGSYIPGLGIKSKKQDTDGLANDLLRYLIMVTNHYANQRMELQALPAQEEEQELFDEASEYWAELEE